MLNKEVVQAYADHLPSALAVLNGYGPSFTFATATSKRPPHNLTAISFDYYLDPSRSVADAAGDLITLAKLNPTSPYLLAVHVREFSDVTRVEKILDLLPEGEFELMPIGYESGSRPRVRTRRLGSDTSERARARENLKNHIYTLTVSRGVFIRGLTRGVRNKSSLVPVIAR